jgi:hypothetical protein
MKIDPVYSPSAPPTADSYLSRFKTRLLDYLSKLTPHKGDKMASNVVKATLLPVTVTLSPIIAIASAILAIASTKKEEVIELKDTASSLPSKHPSLDGLIFEANFDKTFTIKDIGQVHVQARVEGLEGDRNTAIRTFFKAFEEAFKKRASDYQSLNDTEKEKLVKTISMQVFKEIKPLQPLCFAAAILIPESKEKSTLYTLCLGNYQILAGDKPLNLTQTIASNPQIRRLALAGLLRSGNLCKPPFEFVMQDVILPYLNSLITRFPSQKELLEKGKDEEKLVVHEDLKKLETLKNLLAELKKNPPSEETFKQKYLPELQKFSLPRIHPDSSWLQEDLKNIMGPLVVEDKFIESQFDKDGKLQFKNRGTALGLKDSRSLEEIEIKAHQLPENTSITFKRVP